MDEAAFKQLEAIINRVTAFLMKLLHITNDLAVRQAIIAEVNELNALLDKATLSLEGGPR